MSQSRDHLIRRFQEKTHWERNKVIHFLSQYQWDLSYAFEVLYILGEDEFQSDELVIEEKSIDGNLPQSFHNEFHRILSSKHRSNGSKLLFEYINENIIGRNQLICGPWGFRKMFYADYTASGRCLRFIEDYINEHVRPFYGNTHSENNACSLQTTKFREDARALIKKSVNATDADVLIFTGSGSTSAIHKLVNILRLNDENIRSKSVLFYTALEHHSNILPWKEAGLQMIRIPTNDRSLLDQFHLKEKLEFYQNLKKEILCTFTAASNVTGIRTDVDEISSLVHSYNGRIFWDYAAAAPYLPIDMNPSNQGWKDAIFISTHKFIGGPETPGILIAKKDLFHNRIPEVPSGGTVNYVTRERVEYLEDIEIREEGGTPNILGSIRAGLVFQLKDSIGKDQLEFREEQLVKRFFQRFPTNDKLMILGSSKVSRLPIFSFLIYVPQFGKYLHHNFVYSLFNDLFGIQVRSGCACAGPYVLDLLNIDEDKARRYTMFITNEQTKNADHPMTKIGLMKPGFTRLNLPYFANDEEIQYLLDSIEFISEHGWIFLLQYSYNPSTGIWFHHHHQTSMKNETNPLESLNDIHYDFGQMSSNSNSNEERRIYRQRETNSPPLNPIEEAKHLVNEIFKSKSMFNDPELDISVEDEDLIWFVLPKDVRRILFESKKANLKLNEKSIRLAFLPRHSVALIVPPSSFDSKSKKTKKIQHRHIEKK